MSCSEIQNLLSAYYDDEISASARDRVTAHLQDCRACMLKLESFKGLSLLTAELQTPSAQNLWPSLDQKLSSIDSDGSVVHDRHTPGSVRSGGKSSRGKYRLNNRIFFVAAIAVTVLFSVSLFPLLVEKLGHGSMENQMATSIFEMVHELNSNQVPTVLTSTYDGKAITHENAITLVGFQPLISVGMPVGYTVEDMQMLTMPMCKCIQTICKRPDGTRFVLVECFSKVNCCGCLFQQNQTRHTVYSGRQCEVTTLEDFLAATWEKDDRHVTMVGVRDDEELRSLLDQIEGGS